MEASLELPDALALAEAVKSGAEHLARLGSTDTIDGRRATALGDLARHQLTRPAAGIAQAGALGVAVGVPAGVLVGVLVGVFVGELVRVLVGTVVAVWVLVLVGVAVAVLVRVAVGVAVAAGVAVFGQPPDRV